MQTAVNFAKQVNAQYFIFHPDQINDFNSIKSEIPVCIENMNKDKDKYKSVKELQNILEKHSHLGLVVDISHVLGNDLNPSDFLELKNKIKGIHSSGQWIKKGTLKEHGFLTEGTKEQLEKAKPLLKLNVPKVIECDFYPYKIPLIEKEIELLKQLE